MKRYLFLVIAIILWAGTSCQVSIEKEKEAIKAVIEEEQAAYFDRDIDRLEATWIQKSTSRKMFMSSSGVTEINGWIEINKSDREQMTLERQEATKNLTNQYLNYNINVYDNTALVFHDAKWSGKYLGEEINFEQKRILHLVKIEDVWKLDLMAVYGIPQEKEITKEDPDAE